MGRRSNGAVEITCRIRETVGKDVALIADANGAVHTVRSGPGRERPGALRLDVAGGPGPNGHPDSLEEVARAVGVPLAIGKRMVACHSFREVIERQLIDFVQPDCQNVGGILRTRGIALLAESYYMSFALHHSGGPVAQAMNAQVAGMRTEFRVGGGALSFPAVVEQDPESTVRATEWISQSSCRTRFGG